MKVRTLGARYAPSILPDNLSQKVFELAFESRNPHFTYTRNIQ
ncbi:hypothetical protein [Pelagicoccus sp. SDUM812002]|nr:hypothetical protein [Pelagicoccus sp. SDUM812002]MDQ8186970.1 hypothetical protein [Pelagicoccus sp. SDUM812002]